MCVRKNSDVCHDACKFNGSEGTFILGIQMFVMMPVSKMVQKVLDPRNSDVCHDACK